MMEELSGSKNFANELRFLMMTISRLSTIPKMVIPRDIDECNVNPFNPEWLCCWDADMDLQIVIDFYQVITYITDYYSKADDGMIEMLNEALEKSDSGNLKDSMSLLVNPFFAPSHHWRSGSLL